VQSGTGVGLRISDGDQKGGNGEQEYDVATRNHECLLDGAIRDAHWWAIVGFTKPE